ncbi:WLM domain-containing protein [Mycena vitilis]|nr:WLM domain-containing protein [Mycena vitilis]
MVHVRLNERESNPNPFVNFITALDVGDAASQEDARQFLRALAAQVRPIMKSHGFAVNSLEEYEFNMVFAGRNWNSGETVELVLRRPDGSFQSTSWLMGVLCHELAHNKHMNHGPAFQALWKRLRAEVRALQDKGYYGDGWWSSGTRLRDSAEVLGDGIEGGEFPEYLCGGAQKRARPTALRRKRRSRPPRHGAQIASNKTGRQTAKKRKAGGRVTSKYAFSGEGSVLAEGLDPGDEGTGFGKQAASKRAREERALAAERRIQALQASTSKASRSKTVSEDETTEGEVDELEDDDDSVVGETDAERRQALRGSEPFEDLLGLSETSWRQFEDEFIFNGNGKPSSKETIELSSDEDDIPVASGSTFVMPPRQKSTTSDSKDPKTKDREKSSTLNMVQHEISARKKESLGMAPVKAASRVLGGGGRKGHQEPEWACHMCTLLNKESFLACSACSTPRAQT